MPQSAATELRVRAGIEAKPRDSQPARHSAAGTGFPEQIGHNRLLKFSPKLSQMLQQQQTAKSDFLFGRRAANRKKSPAAAPPETQRRRFFGPQHSPAKGSHHTTPTLSVSVNFSLALALRCDRERSGLLILLLQAQQQQQYSMNQHATAFALCDWSIVCGFKTIVV